MLKFSRGDAVLLIMTALIPIIFAVYTQNAWEDWYITFRASKNLALGNGFVFQIGQRVHTFTSPLGALIPAALAFITWNSSDELVLWLYRIISSIFIGGTGVLLWRITKLWKLNFYASLFLIIVFIFDAKTIAYSVNGMETAILLFFLSINIFIFCSEYSIKTPLTLGASWAGLMWTRPDAFVYIASLSAAIMIFPKASASKLSRKEIYQILLAAAAFCSIFYIPWLLWTWYYYGTPVPNTVIAKSPRFESLAAFFNQKYYVVRALIPFRIFLPPYPELGGWPAQYIRPLYFFILAGTLAWVVPGFSARTRALSLSFFFIVGYAFFIVPYPFPWYMPPVSLLGFMTQASAIDDLLKWLGKRTGHVNSAMRQIAYLILFVPILAQIALCFFVGIELRTQQNVIEDGHRRQIGIWLNENKATENDTVLLESLGYIGFFSGLKMYDYPGLSSPEVIRARRDIPPAQDDLPGVFGPLIVALKPDWVVLRPDEAQKVEEFNPQLLNKIYREAKTFDVCDQVRSIEILPGRGYLLFDCKFTVYHRIE